MANPILQPATAPAQPKTYSVDDFANIIKTKYPAYKDKDNNTLVSAWLKKYPAYKNRVSVQQPISSMFDVKKRPSFMGMQPANDTSQSTPAMNSGTDTLGLIKNIGQGAVASEVGAGQDIASALGSKSYMDKFAKLSTEQQKDITSLVSLRNKYAKAGDKTNTNRINTMIKNENIGGTSVADMFPALNKSTEEVLGDFAGVGLDVITAGQVGPELKAGETAVKGATTGTRILKGAATGAAIGAGYGAAGGAQANESPTDILKSTAIGAGAGAVLGGAGEGIFGKKATSLAQTTEDVSPRLTASEAERATTKTSKITKKVSVVPSKRTLDVAAAVHDTIKDGTTFSDKANLADKGIQTEAESLKSQIASVDHPIPKKEASAALKNVEVPATIQGDSKKAYSKVLAKANEIIQKNTGSVSGQLDGRKEFDNFVSRTFPNLYDSDTMTPMRVAIKNLRDAWNSFIESQLPDDVKYTDSLDKQNKLFEARDTLREKAARGAPTRQGEIGTNRFQRFGTRHPVIKKTAQLVGGGAATVVGGGGIYETGKKILGQ